jgi:sulfite exporter TauE/SafE
MITLPLALAAITAGLVGGVHCVGMCGGISTLLSDSPKRALDKRYEEVIPIVVGTQYSLQDEVESSAHKLRHQLLLQGGRLSTYMLIGGFFGGLGTVSLQFKPYLPVQNILFFLGNIFLILLGLRLLGFSPGGIFLQRLTVRIKKFTYAQMPVIRYANRYPFVTGMSWGCLPCGLLYGLAPFALLSGDALSGAVLMMLFGLAAMPHLLMAQSLARRAGHNRLKKYFTATSACLLILIGLFGIWYFDMKEMPSFLCITPIN